MGVSVFELFKIGIGPSSSHTVGPMVAANRFVSALAAAGLLSRVSRVRVELFGSLAATGPGHGTPGAILLGLAGAEPESVDTDRAPQRVDEIRATRQLPLVTVDHAEPHPIEFDCERDLVLHRDRRLDFHPNALTFTAWSGDETLAVRTYYSIGGGFVVDEDKVGLEGGETDATDPKGTRHDEASNEAGADEGGVPHRFRTGAELLAECERHGLKISELVLANEVARRPEAEVRAGLSRVWQVMQDCVRNGQRRPEGTLPGGLHVRRRAPELHARLLGMGGRFRHEEDPLAAMDWVTLWALAVNEENAGGGRVVTAPTNGAAGIIPAVLHYASVFIPGTDENAVHRFLLTAGAIGAIYQQTASISGADVGCQGEVGTACSMAAAGLAEILGGSPAQVECAAEIGMEHHLGMTCDPVGGLVQIPCIERNAVASVKAITAARLALYGDGTQKVSLDQVVRTMRETGADMQAKYKETARGGLAVNLVEC